MKNYIIKIEFNSQRSYVTRIEGNKLVQVSNTYSNGVIEFASKEEAETVSNNLKLQNGKKVLGCQIVEVNK